MAKLNHINVLLNNQPQTMAIEEIFDPIAYPQLQAVTGKLTAEFANQYLADYIKVDLVLGNLPSATNFSANETLTKDALLTALLTVANKDAAKLFQGLSSTVQLNALAGIFRVLVSPTQAIHSRFYLMYNPTTDQNRVVLGSFDLTEASFDPAYNRFEEVLVFDNADLYDQLATHFTKDLLPTTKAYFTDELLSAAEGQLKALKQDQDAQGQKVVIFSNEETDQIVQAELTNLLVKNVQKQIDADLIPSDTPLAMRNVTMDRTREREAEERLIQQRDMMLQLEKEAVSPRAEQPSLRSAEQVAKKVKAALAEAVSPEDLAVEKKYTTFLYDRPIERNVAKNITGLYIPSDTGKYPIPFGQLATVEQIKSGLQQIDAVMNGYQQYVVDYDDNYGKRFFEAILYGFTAPFMWEIRTKSSLNPEDGNDVPNFLILGATAGSGKSTLLRIINQLTWGNENSMIDFGTIYPNETPQRKAKTVQALESYMKQGSTYPVLVDEIEPYFFQQPQYSRHLVVDTMNELVNSPKAIAPLIGTTNYNGSFSMVRETARRTYYIQLDKVINDEKKAEATQYIYDVRQTLNNTLFKDFVVRMAHRLSDDDTDWRTFDATNGQLDFLAITRDIFKEYYQMVKMSVPAYVSDGLCDDFRESSRNKWAKLYLTQMDDFVYRNENNSLVFDITKLNSFNGFSNESAEEYRNSLPIEICVDGINGKSGKFLEMKADAFFNWIGIKPELTAITHENGTTKVTTKVAEEKPKKKKGFWARLFG